MCVCVCVIVIIYLFFDRIERADKALSKQAGAKQSIYGLLFPRPTCTCVCSKR